MRAPLARIMMPTGKPLGISGSAHVNSAAASTLGVTLSAPDGNIVVVLMIETNGGPVTGVTDANSLNWKFRASAGTAGLVIEEWWAFSRQPLASDVITVTTTLSAFLTIDAFAIVGTRSAKPFDTSLALPSVKSDGADPLIATNGSYSLCFAGYRLNNPTGTAGSGWTAISNANFQLVEYQIVRMGQAALDPTFSGTTTNGGISDAVSR